MEKLSLVDDGTLASQYHSGQGSALYAFSSSGTVIEGLASEVRSALAIAEKKHAHWKEVQALKEFLEWAEAEEAKKFPSEE